MISVMFVCLGNICRSPAGEAMLKQMIRKRGKSEDFAVASCGIGDWYVGQMADQRMREAAGARGIVLVSRAQQFKREFLDNYDYILAVDHEVLKDLYHFAAEPNHKAKICLATAFSKSYLNQEIPDPYYGGGGDFELVLDMLLDVCEGFLNEIIGAEFDRNSKY